MQHIIPTQVQTNDKENANGKSSELQVREHYQEVQQQFKSIHKVYKKIKQYAMYAYCPSAPKHSVSFFLYTLCIFLHFMLYFVKLFMHLEFAWFPALIVLHFLHLCGNDILHVFF